MINKCTLLGRLAKDPELKTFPDGGKIANLRIITNRTWKDKNNGEIRQHTEGHTVSIRVPAIAESITSKVKKGDMMYIEGAMETRSWTTNTGEKRYITEVVVRPYGGIVRKLPLSSVSGNNSQNKSAEAEVDETQNDASTTPEENTNDAETMIDFFAEMDDDI
jgi:single-strand DNA-binding protein